MATAGTLGEIVISVLGSISTVNTPVAVSPLIEVNITEKVVSPSKLGASVSIGSTVKVQPLPSMLRVTDASFAASTPVASPQVIARLPSSTCSKASISSVRLAAT